VAEGSANSNTPKVSDVEKKKVIDRLNGFKKERRI
jgi:hypothetical protein